LYRQLWTNFQRREITALSEYTGLGGTQPIGIVTVGDDGTGKEVASTWTLSFVTKIAGRGISGSIGVFTLKLLTVGNGSACSWPGLHPKWSDNSQGSSLN
jgi:hypothetical protein